MMSMMAPSFYNEGFRHAEITLDNQGAILQIAAWFLMVVMILATILRLTIRFATRQVPGLDDTFLTIAMVSCPKLSIRDTCAKEYGKQLFGIGQVIAVSIGVNTGLGKRLSLLNGAQKNNVEKVRAFRSHV